MPEPDTELLILRKSIINKNDNFGFISLEKNEYRNSLQAAIWNKDLILLSYLQTRPDRGVFWLGA